MRASFRTIAFVAALFLALVVLPTGVLAAGGQSLPATLAAAFNVSAEIEQSRSQLPPLGGTVPPPTPRPIPPAPVPPAPRPTPATSSSATQIAQVIGDRLSSTMYALMGNGWLYRSNLDGRAWMMVGANPPVDTFLMSASDPNVLYSGESANCASAPAMILPMYKSTDGGATWTELAAGLNLKPLLIDPADPDTLFAADCSTIYLSTDGGATWSPKPAAAADNLWQTYAPVALASASLVGNPQAPNWDQIFGVGNDFQNTGVVAFTGDRGDSWANIASATNVLSGVTTVEASLWEGGKLWVVDSQGVWVSADYGVNWTLLNEGLTGVLRAGASLNDVTYGQDGSLYLATDAGLFVLAPGATQWVRPDNANFDSTLPMHSFLLTDSNPQRLWINAENADGDLRVFTLAIN